MKPETLFNSSFPEDWSKKNQKSIYLKPAKQHATCKQPLPNIWDLSLKLESGPTIPRPGPTPPMVVATEEMALTISRPINVIARETTKKITIYKNVKPDISLEMRH